MARRFINQFTHQEPIDQIFLAQQKQLRPNRNGNTYLQVELSDRSGIISGRMWNAGEGEYRGFNDGDFVRVEGLAQLFQGQMQLIIHNICRARMDEVNEDDFMPLSPAMIDQLVARLIEILRSIKNPQLRSLADCFVMDETFMAKFARAPAGVKNHHAYVGGLLEHVVNLMEVILLVTPRYPELDPELMLIGALTHDMGKIDELAYDKGFSYTDEGQLIGHLVMAVSTVERKAAEAQKLTGEAIPEETLLRIKHMIISHHGEYEYGSPKLPMTLEAIALHQLDNLDAKLHSFGQLMREDPNVESHWTAYQASLGRKLFKGGK
ncbi:MAG: HD domain-containing protein [Planctomycetaceae bacterium]|nr:HD domain-containing protein [Planctomycetaceae bacterium]